MLKRNRGRLERKVRPASVRVTRKGRVARRGMTVESLEERLPLTISTGLIAGTVTGNDCPPDLDLSAVVTQQASVGQTLTIDLLSTAIGGTVVDLDVNGDPTGDVVRLVLDPDVPSQTAEGATLTEAGVFSWTPSVGQTGLFEFFVIAIDSGPTPLADAESFFVDVGNQPPVVDLNGPDEGTGFTTSFTEGDGAIPIVSPELTVTDPDSLNLNGALVRLTNLDDATAETLNVDTSGTNITATYASGTGVLGLVGEDTVENYQRVLRTLTYINTSENPQTDARLIEVTVTDGESTSEVALSTVNIIAVNDPPNLAPIDDVNAIVGELLEVTVTATDAESDTLTFQLDPDDPFATLPDGLSISYVDGSTTSAVIRWTPTAEDVGEFTFVVIVLDGGNPALADREEFTVTVSASPVPVVDLNGPAAGNEFTADFTEGDVDVAIVSAEMTVSDADSEDLESATVTLTNRPDGSDESLSVTVGTTGIAANYDPSTGVLSLTGTNSVENYQQVLRTLVYNNASSDPDETTRAVTVTVSDGTNTSVEVTTNVTVTAIDPVAPTLTLPPPFDDSTTPIARTVGQTISFTVIAADADSPDSDLTFSVDASGIPATAGVPTISGNPPTGTFLWMLEEVGTYTVTLIVTDADALADQESFTVVVSAAAMARAPVPDALPVTNALPSDNIKASLNLSPRDLAFADMLAADEEENESSSDRFVSLEWDVLFDE